MYQESSFKPAWWLSNAHVQTMSAKWLRRKLVISTITQRLTTPDNDIIDLAWTELPSKDQIKPIAVILHGLEGSIHSHYAKGMMQKLTEQGWIGLLIHFRGCGNSVNRLAISYHSGFTADITFVSQWIQSHFPNNPKCAIGFSLGGNVLVQYLAQAQENSPYAAATVICAPLDLASCSIRMNQGFSKIYQKYLVDMLKKSALDKIKRGLISHIHEDKISSLKTLWAFDDCFTAPINGFIDANDYYQQASGLNNINQITIPSLIIHAQDDPFLAHNSITSLPRLNDNIRFEVSRKGGHVGFVASKSLFKHEFWLEHRTINYLKSFI